jgi:hypothetical protein
MPCQNTVAWKIFPGSRILFQYILNPLTKARIDLDEGGMVEQTVSCSYDGFNATQKRGIGLFYILKSPPAPLC